MKKGMAILLAIAGLLVAGVFVLLVQAGLFYKVQVTEGVTGPYTIVYVEQTGDYAKAAQAGNTVYQVLMAEYGINTTKGFGIYYDDPAKVAKDKLRSEIGCILEPSDSGKAKAITKFKVRTLEAKNSLIASHPFTNPFSIILGISKVYPEFSKKLGGQPSGYTYSMEIYDMPARTTTYLMR